MTQESVSHNPIDDDVLEGLQDRIDTLSKSDLSEAFRRMAQRKGEYSYTTLPTSSHTVQTLEITDTQDIPLDENGVSYDTFVVEYRDTNFYLSWRNRKATTDPQGRLTITVGGDTTIASRPVGANAGNFSFINNSQPTKYLISRDRTQNLTSQVDPKLKWVSPLDYGAVADGIADDSVALYNASQAAGEGTVYIGSGETLFLGSNLKQFQIPSKLHIDGTGKLILSADTILTLDYVPASTGQAFDVSAGGQVRFSRVRGNVFPTLWGLTPDDDTPSVRDANTLSIQSAINAVAWGLGGAIDLPSGHYYCGSIYFYYDPLQNPNYPSNRFASIRLKGNGNLSLDKITDTPTGGTTLESTASVGGAFFNVSPKNSTQSQTVIIQNLSLIANRGNLTPTVTHNGVGLNDMSVSLNEARTPSTYRVICVGRNPDLVRVYRDNVKLLDDTPIVSPVQIDGGVSVSFVSAIGHQTGDEWEFQTKPGYVIYQGETPGNSTYGNLTILQRHIDGHGMSVNGGNVFLDSVSIVKHAGVGGEDSRERGVGFLIQPNENDFDFAQLNALHVRKFAVGGLLGDGSATLSEPFLLGCRFEWGVAPLRIGNNVVGAYISKSAITTAISGLLSELPFDGFNTENALEINGEGTTHLRLVQSKIDCTDANKGINLNGFLHFMFDQNRFTNIKVEGIRIADTESAIIKQCDFTGQPSQQTTGILFIDKQPDFSEIGDNTFKFIDTPIGTQPA